MALLNLDDCLTVKKVKKDFNSETGLHLLVYSNDIEADDNLKLEKIMFNNTPLSRSRFYHDQRLIHFYSLCFGSDILGIKNGIFEKYGIEINISDGKNILDDNANLADYVSKKIMNKKYDYVKLNVLNERLVKIEKDIYNQYLNLKNRLDLELADKNEWLSDYEIQVEISYHIDESDPLFYEDSDNIIVSYKKSCEFLNEELFIKCPLHTKGFISPDCILFHDLHDHCGIAYEDIQRIGRIWVDINVWHQHCYEKE